MKWNAIGIPHHRVRGLIQTFVHGVFLLDKQYKIGLFTLWYWELLLKLNELYQKQA